jgi:hypothetical protein
VATRGGSDSGAGESAGGGGSWSSATVSPPSRIPARTARRRPGWLRECSLLLLGHGKQGARGCPVRGYGRCRHGWIVRGGVGAEHGHVSGVLAGPPAVGGDLRSQLALGGSQGR